MKFRSAPAHRFLRTHVRGPCTNGLRKFDYDAENRHSKTGVNDSDEGAKAIYLHNVFGQRVFKSEPQVDYTAPTETTLGTDFITWLKTNFKWLFATAQANASLGSIYVYGDGQIPSWAILGEYNNGAATGSGRTEYIWLPTDDGNAIPVAMFRGSRYYAIHSDHLGTPRLMTDDTAKPVWQWPYSAFGETKPTGILTATANPNAAMTAAPLLKATAPAAILNLRFPGQYFDSETNLFYNSQRTYDPIRGSRYTQADPIGLEGGWNRFGYVEGNPTGRIDPLGLDWIWSQSTGTLTNTSNPGNIVATGYAGSGAGLNNPAMQGVSNTGPIPQGTWNIGGYRNSPNTGPLTIVLTPAEGTETFGRSAFRIHGDNGRGNQSASQGCIIVGRDVRTQILNSSDRVLRVVP